MIERYPSGDRAAWLSLRARDLTASDIGAACGVDPYKTPLQLYGEKRGELQPAADNPMMARGRWLEPAVVAALREENPDWDIRYPLSLYLRDPDARLGATPDAVAATDRPGITNLQLKVVAKPEFDRSWAAGPPLAYVLQTLCEGLLLDVDQSLLVALVIDSYTARLHYAEVPRHAAAEARLHDIAAAFWERVATGRRPPADVARDAETVAAMFPQSKPEPVLDLSGDNRLAELLPTRTMLKTEIAGLEKDVAKIDVEIKAKLGEHELALLPGWKISWKTQQVAEQIRPATTRRPLLVTAVEAKEQAA